MCWNKTLFCKTKHSPCPGDVTGFNTTKTLTSHVITTKNCTNFATGYGLCMYCVCVWDKNWWNFISPLIGKLHFLYFNRKMKQENRNNYIVYRANEESITKQGINILKMNNWFAFTMTLINFVSYYTLCKMDFSIFFS